MLEIRAGWKKISCLKQKYFQKERIFKALLLPGAKERSIFQCSPTLTSSDMDNGLCKINGGKRMLITFFPITQYLVTPLLYSFGILRMWNEESLQWVWKCVWNTELIRQEDTFWAAPPSTTGENGWMDFNAGNGGLIDAPLTCQIDGYHLLARWKFSARVADMLIILT